MKKQLLAIALGALFISFNACQSGSKSTQQDKVEEKATDTVAFKTAENYFINNTVKQTVPAKITTQEEFDNYFGMATTMGENGKPTAIDFSKEYVIAIDYGQTNNKAEIALSGIEKKGEDIIVNYTVNEGENAGFETHPFLMLIVSKDVDGNVVLNKR